ncbi:UNVERIFIED_CONTAM: hypothetical protein GTU68_042989, partial [Idotea baltica]|nr:hypothetical protein [Idotea baltica]
MKATRENLDWPAEPFYVPAEVSTAFAERATQLEAYAADWAKQFESWKSSDAKRSEQLQKQLALETPADLEQRLVDALPNDGKAVATRKLSQAVLQAASEASPALIGGSADLEPSTLTLVKDSTDVLPGQFKGRNLRLGVREHGMGAIMNGMAYYGGFVPYGSTFLCFLDYMRPSVRLAALSGLPTLYIYTHDSVFLGEDGPTHQPVEHVAILRMTPNLYTLRPADGLETAVSYAMALERKDGPSALILSRQGLPQLERAANFDRADIRKGGYAVKDCEGTPELVFVASGSEVSLALEAAEQFADKKVRVVSMPCAERFLEQDAAYREALVPAAAKKVIIEAGLTFGW